MYPSQGPESDMATDFSGAQISILIFSSPKERAESDFRDPGTHREIQNTYRHCGSTQGCQSSREPSILISSMFNVYDTLAVFANNLFCMKTAMA